MTQCGLNDGQRSLRQPRETFAREATIPVAVPHDDSRVFPCGSTVHLRDGASYRATA